MDPAFNMSCNIRRMGSASRRNQATHVVCLAHIRL